MSLTLPAISLLNDTVVSLYFPSANGGDVGVRATWGSAVPYGMDKASAKASLNTADHSAGQNTGEITRGNKQTGEVTLEMKAFVDAVQGFTSSSTGGMKPGTQIKMIGVATVGAHTMTCTVLGIITEVELEISGPSTYKITIKPYAVDSTAFIDWEYA